MSDSKAVRGPEAESSFWSSSTSAVSTVVVLTDPEAKSSFWSSPVVSAGSVPGGESSFWSVLSSETSGLSKTPGNFTNGIWVVSILLSVLYVGGASAGVLL